MNPGDRAPRIASWIAVVAGLAVLAWCVQQGVAHRNPDNDFSTFYKAAAALRSGENIYAVGQNHYNYPPLLAVLVLPLSALSFGAASIVWSCLMAALLALTAWLAADTMAERLGLRRDPFLTCAAASIGVLLLSEAFKREFEWGNSNVLSVLGVVLGLRWLDRRPALAGLVLGLAFCGKYASAPMLPYLLLRGRWRAAGSMVLGIAAGLFAPALVIGWDLNATYLGTAFGGVARSVGLPVQRASEMWPLSWEFSLSLPSAAARWADRLGQGPLVILAIVVAAGVACLAIALLSYRATGTPMFRRTCGPLDQPSVAGPGPSEPAVTAVEWAGLSVILVAFGPQTLQRHLNLLLPMTVLAAWLLLGALPQARRWRVGLAMVLLIGLAVMPPTGGGLRSAVYTWREVGGMAVAVLASYLVLLHEVLRTVTLTSPSSLRSQSSPKAP
jgi:hypothetical protein